MLSLGALGGCWVVPPPLLLLLLLLILLLLLLLPPPPHPPPFLFFLLFRHPLLLLLLLHESVVKVLVPQASPERPAPGAHNALSRGRVFASLPGGRCRRESAVNGGLAIGIFVCPGRGSSQSSAIDPPACGEKPQAWRGRPPRV